MDTDGTSDRDERGDRRMRREERREGGDLFIARPVLIPMLFVTGKTSGAFPRKGRGE